MRYLALVILAWLTVPGLASASEPVCHRQSLSGVLTKLCLLSENKGRLLSLDVENQTVFVIRLEFATAVSLKQLGTDKAGAAKYLTLEGGCTTVPLVLGEPGVLCNFSLGHRSIVKDVAFRL